MKLLFDHIYRVIGSTGFEELKEIMHIFPIASHEKKDTNYGFWEGIYIRANNGNYLEFIKEDEYWKQNFISLCSSLNGKCENLHQKIIEKYSHHKFKLYEINTPTGEPWMLTSMLEPPLKDIYFYAVEYRGKKKVERESMGKSEHNWLESIDSIEFNINNKQYDHFTQITDWFVKDIKKDNHSISFSIPTPSGDEFKMFAHLKKNDYDKAWFKFSGKYDKEKCSNIDLKHVEKKKNFKFEFRDGLYSIEYKKS